MNRRNLVKRVIAAGAVVLFGAGARRRLAAMGEIPEDEMKLLEWWFMESGRGKPGDREDERNFKRRSISQLLNNWSKELDRANAYADRPGPGDGYSDIPDVTIYS